jgi:SAM-dependent methyltransferase
VRDRVDHFIQANLDDGIPEEAGDGYDVVLGADVIEHVREPGVLLAQMKDRLGRGGSIVTSVPNFGHWYPRARVAIGKFDYDRRGILDRGHLRFFTRRSFERLAESQGLRVRRREYVGLPFDVAGRRGGLSAATPRAGSGLRTVDQVAVNLRPTLFAYQFLFELEPTSR